MAQVKTNAMRILDQKKIKYQLFTYDSSDGKIDGISVASKIGRDERSVFKTLVLQSANKNIFVYIIPVAEELDLKKAAQSAKEKKVEMIPINDILKLTGYIRGGCSPVGMKKNYKTFIDSSAHELDTIVVSGGKIGVQIEIGVADLAAVTSAELTELIK